MHYLKQIAIYSLLATQLLSGCSAATRSFSAGEKLEADGRYEEAMYSYADAFQSNPEISDYRVRFLKARDKAAELHYKRGSALYEQGSYAAALAEFQASIGLDPTQARYQQKVDVTVRLKDAQLAYQEGVEFENANKFKEAYLLFSRALELDPENRDYRAAQTRVAGLRKSKLEGHELSLKSAKPITLKFKDAKIKDVFNIVTQLSGINFIFDEGVKDQPVTIYIENATFQQVLDLLTNMYKLGRKIANESTVIIYPKNPEKTKQYEDMTLRTFHLSYMDAKKAVNLIRTMLQVRKIYVNEESNALVVRDTSDVVDVVEKILDANDVPEPEVILDVEVIEVSDTDGSRLGMLLTPYNVQLGAFSPPDSTGTQQLLSNNSLAPTTTTIATGATATTTSVGIANLIKAFSIKGYAGFLTVPNATFNFAKTLSNSEVLSNPKIRVKNKEKSKFTVGTRVPITTTNTTNNTVSVNVQYVDVGVKLNAEPTIQLNNEVVIKLSLEVSQTVGAPQVVGDTSVVTIGTRNLETVLSLKDGETSIIGGLIQHTNGESKNKIFLLSDIPFLGPLLTDTSANHIKTELMLAITPRLVRGVVVPQNSLMSFSSGKEDDPSLVRPLASFDQEPVFENVPKTAGQPTLPQAMLQLALKPAPQPEQQLSPQMVQPPVFPLAAPAAPVFPLPNIPPLPPAQPQRGILQISAPVAATVGQQFSLEVKAGTVTDLAGAPFVLTYDPAFVEFISAAEGSFLKKDGVATTFSTTADAAGGAVSVILGRPAGKGGASGGGTLASFVFRAKNRGPANFGFRNVTFTTADGRPLTMLPFSTAMDIR